MSPSTASFPPLSSPIPWPTVEKLDDMIFFPLSPTSIMLPVLPPLPSYSQRNPFEDEWDLKRSEESLKTSIIDDNRADDPINSSIPTKIPTNSTSVSLPDITQRTPALLRLPSPDSPNICNRDFVIGLEELGKRFCVTRLFEAFSRNWRLTLERNGDGAYISISVQRLDCIEEVLHLSVEFECRINSYAFSAINHTVGVGPQDVISEPFFVCPQRQRAYLKSGKSVGIGVTLTRL